MNQFFTEVSKLTPIQLFAGGNETQRDHLNQLVEALNAIIQFAANCEGFDKLIALIDGMERRPTWAEENGEPVGYDVLAQKNTDIVQS